MTSIYAKATVCKPDAGNACYSLEPDITNILAKSRDYDELLWVWKEWYNATGPKMKSLYRDLVDVINRGAREKGYDDASQEWMAELETDNLEKLVDALYIKLKPFYQQLHAYVRRKLMSYYGADKFKTRMIPIHILGLFLP